MQIKSLQTKRALRTTLLVLLLSLAGMGKGYAQSINIYDVTIGSLRYHLCYNPQYVTSPEAYVCGLVNGANATGNLVIPSSVTYTSIENQSVPVTRTYTVTRIYAWAFKDCSGLTSVTIPNSVTTIGNGAFSNCSGLASFDIPNSVIWITKEAFLGTGWYEQQLDGVLYLDNWCLGYKGEQPTGTLILNGNTRGIANEAFYNCSELTGSLTIPNSVKILGVSAFSDCSGLTGSLTIGNSVTTIGSSAFYNCSGFSGNLIIPNSVTTIGDSAFGNCSGFTGNLIIPNSVTTIGDSAFGNCSGFTGNLTIGNSVTEIGNSAFNNCSGLNGSLTIGNSVATIGDRAFYGCLGLTGSLTLPNSLEAIYYEAFCGCNFIGHLTIPDSVYAIDSRAFSGCSGITGLTIGKSALWILEAAFENCSGIEQIVVSEQNPYYDSRNNCNAIIHNFWPGGGGGGQYYNELVLGCKNTIIPNTVTSISDKAFYGCSGLESISIPNSVTSIGIEAFYGCSVLNSITIPNSVTSMGNNVFDECTSLREINFNAKNCTNNLWNNCPEITTVVLGDSVEIVKEGIFSNRSNLTTLSIGKSVKSIEKEAFANNPRLNMIYYNVEKDLVAPAPQSFNNNEYTAFYNCPNLTTIHIGPEVKEIGSNIFKGCNTVHFVVALGPTPAVLDAGAFSDIVHNSVLMVSCGKRVTYYSVWNMFPFNNIIEDCDTYGINVGAVGSGGTITPSVTEAQMGQEVQITITPNPGMVLVSIKVVNANDPTQIIPISPSGKAASTYSFTMPPFEVVVMATFKSSGASVDENNSVEVAVYPNPTNGLVKIEAENIKHVSISNILGQIVFDGKVGGDAFEYDFSGQKAGIYLVRIETANGVVVKKISVTR